MSAFLHRTFHVSLAPQLLLGVAAVWSYFFYSVQLPLPPLAFLALVVAAIIGSSRLYRETRIPLVFQGKDLLVLLGLLVGNTAIHWKGLFQSLGGDELYHASQSMAILRAFQSYVDSLAPVPLEYVRESMWHQFDVRHLPILEIWRVCALVIVLAFLSIFFLTAKLKGGRSRDLFFGVILIALAIGGRWISPSPEIHPPLRTLPLFLSALIFGLSDFAFRLPSIVGVALAAWGTYLFIRKMSPGTPFIAASVIGCLTCFIPQVFYLAECVEPSVWGYLGCVLAVILSLTALRRSDEWIVVAMGVVAGLSVLLRQTTIVLWIPTLAILLSRKEWRSAGIMLRTSAPGLVFIPYLISTRLIGHVAVTANELSAFDSILVSLTSGTGPVSMVNSTTLIWSALFLFLFFSSICRASWKETALYAWFFPAYALFFTIWPYLWGIGRYQVEYVTPFFILALLLHVSYAPHLCRKAVLLLTPLFALYSIEVQQNLSLDTNYRDWPTMRITTSAHFPYRDAIRTLKRMETGGRFVILGGTPLNGDFLLWTNGMTFTEAKMWRETQDGFMTLLSKNPTIEEMFRHVREKNIQYLVVQTGTRRENQHRSPEIASVIAKLEEVALNSRLYFYRTLTFLDSEGGTLIFYAPKVPK